MKILAIRGKNLASLEHSFEIDFTTEPLKSVGIFAITGSTGSGKSTLLDALCLALFDDAPRTSHASERDIKIQDIGDRTLNQNDSRTILRRGASEGYAEVDFISLSGEKFRSRWSVRRARNKVDGSMQDAEIQLSNLTTNSEEQGRKTELLARIVSLIGLTFDQFTRSVLLAQGDFATFLKAKQSEKAELLEKLTGTDIYSRISSVIFEKTRIAKEELSRLNEKINDIKIIPEEQIETIRNEQETKTSEIKKLDSEVKIITEKTQWIKQNETIQADLDKTKKEFFSAKEQKESAKSRYEYLAQIDSVQDIRDIFNMWKNTLEQIKNKTKELQEKEKQINESKNWIEKNKRFEKIPPIIKSVKTWIHTAETTQKDIESNSKKIEQNKNDIAKHNIQLQKLQAEAERLKSLLSAEIAELRAKLIEGEPCPVCGSIHHVVTNIAENTEKEQNINNQKDKNKHDIDTITERINALNISSATLQNQIENDEKQLSEAMQNLTEYFCVIPDWKNYILQSGFAEKIQKFVDEWNKNEDNLKKGNSAIEQIKSDIEKSETNCKKSQAEIEEWSKNRTITLETLQELFSKNDSWIKTERNSLDSITKKEISTEAAFKECEKNFNRHQLAEIKPINASETRVSLQNLFDEKSALIKQYTNRIAEIKITVQNNEQNKEKAKNLGEEYAKKNLQYESWSKLNVLLGSRDGDKFKKIAQCYTLETLLGFANKHLQELAPRYKLQRISDSLALQVVDLDMLNEVRTVHTLSGGESFLISLALALGLSSLSSNRMKVESLFIDEGFGSLDNDTLRIAMDALEHLQTQGRKIGVISHVTEMTERIAVQIKVIKTANGKSEVTVCGN